MSVVQSRNVLSLLGSSARVGVVWCGGVVELVELGKTKHGSITPVIV